MKITDREREILSYLCQGFVNKEIAQKLGVEKSTVRGNLDRLRKKFNCPNSIALAAYVERENLLSDKSHQLETNKRG